MTADPVRPQETLRDRIAQSLAERRVSVQTAPWIVWDALWRGVRIELGHVNAEALADAVLPIVEEETARQLAVLREKVKALADEWDALWRGVRNPGNPYNGGWIDGVIRCIDDLQRALVEEPQGGEQ